MYITYEYLCNYCGHHYEEPKETKEDNPAYDICRCGSKAHSLGPVYKSNSDVKTVYALDNNGDE